MNPLPQSPCPVCGSHTYHAFFDMLDVPIYCNLLWPEQQAAQACDKGDIRLAFCLTCGFIGNTAFDPTRLSYTQAYENSLDFSPKFQDYAQGLATQLIERHGLKHKKVIEIGCGKGEFLVLLSKLGDNWGIGFDPTYVPLSSHAPYGDRIDFIQDFYSEDYAHYQGDLICCRHTLEHVPEPTKLLQTVRNAIGDTNTPVFFEVPNALYIFHQLAIWDIIYEHCCYFAPVTLVYAFSTCGFRVQEVRDEFQDQFLCIEATPTDNVQSLTQQQANDIQQIAQDLTTFTTAFERKLQTWREQLDTWTAQKQRVVVWGAGSKGVTFLNLLGAASQIDYVVDINPRKQGMYVAGTGQQIVSPEFLSTHHPSVILVMNPNYANEIQQMTTDLGLNAELVCV
jgi:SAM-dependent methyltransferase